MKRLAPQNPPYRQPATAKHAVADDRKPRVLRAGRREAAGLADPRREQPLIAPDRPHGHPRQRTHRRVLAPEGDPVIAENAPRSSSTSPANFISNTRVFPTTTIAAPSGASPRAARYAARSLRLTRLRSTARLSWRLTANPMRRGGRVSVHNRTHDGRSMRLPLWKSDWNSALLVNRSLRGSRPVRRSGVYAPSRADA